MFSRSMKVGSSSFCCRDVLVLAISVWRWLILIFVHLILLWMSECFIIACSHLLPFHLICEASGVTLFARHLRLKIIAVLDLASCISSFSNFLASSRVSWFNSIDTHIKFTVELPGTAGLPCLDTLTKPTPNSIESTVYRKPTHTNRS